MREVALALVRLVSEKVGILMLMGLCERLFFTLLPIVGIMLLAAAFGCLIGPGWAIAFHNGERQ